MSKIENIHGGNLSRPLAASTISYMYGYRRQLPSPHRGVYSRVFVEYGRVTNNGPLMATSVNRPVPQKNFMRRKNMEHKDQSSVKLFSKPLYFLTCYPDGYHSTEMAPKCPDGTVFPNTLCPCSDMKQLNIHQAAYEPSTSQWIRGKDHAIHMQQWMIVFPVENVKHLGSCVYKELVKIADYGAAFFADEYQIFYTIQYTSALAFIRFSMNTVSLQAGKEYTESMAGRQQEYFDYLLDFVLREYGLSIGTDIHILDIFT